ncbi:MAG: N-acetylneuraminate synthase family protein [Methanospirillaceae archaeon]|nr:N-acetylneuraminate synthase family protein [Methanospirillaceae archaeon]
MTREFRIGKDIITDDPRSYVIAEIGHNHQGNIETCKKMFLSAKQCGVNAVKLQKRTNKLLYTKELYNSPYDNENSFGATYGEHREFLEFDTDEYIELKNFADELGLSFFCTAFDIPSVDFLEDIGIHGYKIASGDLKNTPLIAYIAKTGKPIILSTGGGTLEDVQRAYDTIRPWNRNFCILQCTACYPVEPEDMNLKVITTFREKFPDVVIGLSDHQNGISMALVAYMLKARVFEKHFTLNHSWKGSDHSFSLEPIGMSKLCRDLKRAMYAIGDGVKKPIPGEINPLIKMGKQLVASRDIPKGHQLTVLDIAIKSPINIGLPPYEFNNIIGMVTKKPLSEDDPISRDILTK